MGLNTAYLKILMILLFGLIAACGGEIEEKENKDNPDLDPALVRQMKEALRGVWIGPCNKTASGHSQLTWEFDNSNRATQIMSLYGPGGCSSFYSVQTRTKNGTYGITDLIDNDEGSLTASFSAPHWDNMFVEIDIDITIGSQQMSWVIQSATMSVEGTVRSVNAPSRVLQKNPSP